MVARFLAVMRISAMMMNGNRNKEVTMNKPICILSAFVVFLFSCSQEAEKVFQPGETITFTASWGGSDTRTVLQADGNSVWWETGEQINVFFSDKASGMFTSTNNQPQAIVDFQGSLPIVVGSIESDNPAHAYWAVYPYNSANTSDGESVTITIPSVQPAREGTFADKLFPSIATSTNFHLAFYNVCGGARFTVENDGITSITFKANNGESLAGRVRVGFEGVPVIKSIIDGVIEVTVNAPDGGFVPGKFYFATLLPQTLSKGVSLTFRKSDGKVATTSLDQSITINRSRFGKMEEKDKGLEFVDDGGGHNPSDIIVFADSRIKNHCVAAYDTNGDGEISFAEAAAVTTIEGVFTSTLYTSFDEFQYFTSVTAIPDGWFKDRVRLTNITLPDGITSIGSSAFQNCNGLTSINYPSKLKRIGSNAFADCSVLKRVDLCRTEDWVIPEYANDGSHPFIASNEGHLYINDVEVHSVTIPEGLTSLQYCKFASCKEIEEVYFPKGINRVYGNTFGGCEKLVRVHIPSAEDWLKISFLDYGSSPFYSSQEGHLYIDGKELTSIVIPENVNAISSFAFWFCTGLERIEMEPTVPPALGTRVFEGIRCPVFVWKECYEAYCNTWREYTHLILINELSVPEAVDLGLSVKWASFNLGASQPTEEGWMFAWGETVGAKDFYYGSSYKWIGQTWETYSKYVIDPRFGDNGFTDGKSVLEPEDDAAHVHLGGKWRIPTREEWIELIENCRFDPAPTGSGYEITSLKNGNSIILPWTYTKGTSSHLYPGEYLSSSLFYKPDESYLFSGIILNDGTLEECGLSRYYGYPIRPVSD